MTAWNDTAVDGGADGPRSRAGGDQGIGARSPELGVTVVRFANGVEAWFKPTDFKNDQVLFSLVSQGGSSLAPPEQLHRGVAGAGAGRSCRASGGHTAVDLQKLLAGKIASASPSMSSSSHGISGRSNPANLETALQLLYLEFTAPGDDADAFALIKKTARGGVPESRPRSRRALRREGGRGEHQRPLHAPSR